MSTASPLPLDVLISGRGTLHRFCVLKQTCFGLQAWRSTTCPKVYYLPQGLLPAPRSTTCPKVYYLPQGLLPAPRSTTCPKVYYLPQGLLPAPRSTTCPKVYYLPQGLLPAPRSTTCPKVYQCLQKTDHQHLYTIFPLHPSDNPVLKIAYSAF